MVFSIKYLRKKDHILQLVHLDDLKEFDEALGAEYVLRVVRRRLNLHREAQAVA